MVQRLSTMQRPGFDPWVGKIPWRSKWQSTPVLLFGKSHGWRSLVGYSPWGCKELDMTEQLHFHFYSQGPEQKSRIYSPVFPYGEGDSCEFIYYNQSFCKYSSHRDFLKKNLIGFIHQFLTRAIQQLEGPCKRLHKMERFYRKKSGVREQLAKEKKGLFLGQDIFWGIWTLRRLTTRYS